MHTSKTFSEDGHTAMRWLLRCFNDVVCKREILFTVVMPSIVKWNHFLFRTPHWQHWLFFPSFTFAGVLKPPIMVLNMRCFLFSWPITFFLLRMAFMDKWGRIYNLFAWRCTRIRTSGFGHVYTPFRQCACSCIHNWHIVACFLDGVSCPVVF